MEGWTDGFEIRKTEKAKKALLFVSSALLFCVKSVFIAHDAVRAASSRRPAAAASP